MRSATGIALAAAAAGALALPAAAAASPYSDAVLSSGPLSYFEMDETSGFVAVDSSPNHRDGAYTKAGLGASGAFSGSARGVSLGSESSVDSVIQSRSGSVQMWVKPASSRRQQSFASHGNPRGDGWSVGIGARRKVVFVSGGKVVDSKLSLPSARWTMLSVTWDAERVRFYANGGATIKAKPMAAPVPVSSEPKFTVGSSASGVFSGAFQGGVDEVAVFSEALPATAIKGHFAATSLPINVAPPTIVGDAVEGATLTAAPGRYDLETGTTREYQWERCDSSGYDCEELPASESTYKLTSEDVGSTLQVAETASNAVGATTVISEPTGVVQAAAVIAPSTGIVEPVTGTTDPGAVTTDPTTGTTPPAAPSTGTEDAALGTAVQADSAGTTTPNAAMTDASPGTVTGSCARMVYTLRAPHTRRTRMARVGRVTLSARAKRPVSVSSPLRVAVGAKRGKLQKVTFRLDGKKLRIDRKAPYTATIRPNRLAPGKHVLRARVVARNGRAKTLTLRLTARGC